MKTSSLDGLAEADRLGLHVSAEILQEAVSMLATNKTAAPGRGERLAAAEAGLLAVANTLGHSPSSSEITQWRLALDPAARAFARAVRELPLR